MAKTCNEQKINKRRIQRENATCALFENRWQESGKVLPNQLNAHPGALLFGFLIIQIFGEQVGRILLAVHPFNLQAVSAYHFLQPKVFHFRMTHAAQSSLGRKTFRCRRISKENKLLRNPHLALKPESTHGSFDERVVLGLG